jgi:hypothetical protein
MSIVSRTSGGWIDQGHNSGISTASHAAYRDAQDALNRRLTLERAREPQLRDPIGRWTARPEYEGARPTAVGGTVVNRQTNDGWTTEVVAANGAGSIRTLKP